MELQRIVWAWESVIALLLERDQELAVQVGACCRPIAADRRHDGSLFLVLGCWVPEVRRALLSPELLDGSTRLIGTLLGEELKLSVVVWPVKANASTEELNAKLRTALQQAKRGDLLAVPPAEPPSPMDADRLSDELRFELSKCDSILQRMLFAEMVSQAAMPNVQYRVGNYRVDLALPSARIGVDIEGWEQTSDGRRGPSRNPREEEILSHGWLTLQFTGKEVYENVDACSRKILNAFRARRARTDVR